MLRGTALIEIDSSDWPSLMRSRLERAMLQLKFVHAELNDCGVGFGAHIVEVAMDVVDDALTEQRRIRNQGQKRRKQA